MKKNLLIVSILIITLAGGTWFAIYWSSANRKTTSQVQIKTYEDCESAGYKISGSDQKVCTTPEGLEFNEPNRQVSTLEHTSQKGKKVIVTEPLSGSTVKSPLKIKGLVQGSWSFEASFPVSIVDSNGEIISQVPAKLLGDWTTDSYVPFEATIMFDAQLSGSKGTLVLKRDNPSGLPENDDSVSIQINF